MLIEFHSGYPTLEISQSVYKSLEWPLEKLNLKTDFFQRFLKTVKSKSPCDVDMSEFDEDGWLNCMKWVG